MFMRMSSTIDTKYMPITCKKRRDTLNNEYNPDADDLVDPNHVISHIQTIISGKMYM